MARCASRYRLYLMAGSLILLVVSVEASAAPVSWVLNADGLWQTAANWSSNPSLPGATDDVTIDRPADITVTLSSGDQFIRSLTSQENLVVGGGTALTLTIGTGGGLINGALTVSPGAQLAVSGGSFQANGTVTANDASLYAHSAGQLNLPTLTSYSNPNGSQLRAHSGSTLNLSPLTSYTGGTGYQLIQAHGTGSLVNMSGVTSFSGGTYYNTKVYAQEGGTVNLSGVSSITNGSVDVLASGTGSIVNLTNLATLSMNNFSDARRLRAEGGGVITSPNLTTISGGVSIELSGASSVLDLADVTNFNDNSLLVENGATLSLPGAVTSYSNPNGSQLRAHSGGTLNLSSLTSYTGGTGYQLIQAYGTSSLVNMSGVTSFSGGTYYNTKVYAQEGGTVNLSGVSSITNGSVDVLASGTGSIVNLTNLATLSMNNFSDARRLRAEGGGVIISPNLTTISGGVSIELSGASSVLDLADVTNFNDNSLLAENGATLTLPGAVTSYSTNGSQLRAHSGGTLNLSPLTSYTGGTGYQLIQAHGTGSLVNMSGVTSFSGGTYYNTKVYAQEGGTVNLSGVSSITNGSVDVLASGTGSIVNLTNLATLSMNNFSDARRLRAEGGGQIISPDLTTIDNVSVELSDTSSVLNLSDVTNIDNSSLLAENGATLALPAAVTSYSNPNGSQLRALSGGTLNLSPLTSYTGGTGSQLIQAHGTGSLVNMSGVTSFSGGTYYNTKVYAQEGGTVNLSGVSSITNGSVDVLASGTGSIVSLANLTTLSMNNFSDTRRVRAEGGGLVRIKSSGTTTVENASVEVDASSSIEGDTLVIGSGATLSGNGLIDANYSQLSGGTMKFNVGGLTADSQYDQMVIDGNATLGGTLNVLLTNDFIPIAGQSFDILQVNGTLSGTFDNALLGYLTGGLHWNVVYNLHSVVLEVVGIYGDYSGNGIFDAADYVVWRKFQNNTGRNQPADGDRNLDVNDLDYEYWRTRFGQTSGGSASALGVPEPAVSALVVIAAAASSFGRRRRAAR